MFVWLKLLKPTTTDEQRFRALWWSFLHIAVITACTLVYFVSEIRAGFADIGQGWIYGVGFTFLFMNLAFMTYPIPTLYFIYLQIDYLTGRAGQTLLVEQTPSEEARLDIPAAAPKQQLRDPNQSDRPDSPPESKTT